MNSKVAWELIKEEDKLSEAKKLLEEANKYLKIATNYGDQWKLILNIDKYLKENK